ncbi:MAG: GC-type dockerin domain-anchored protein [Phycisphaerales bacterium]
MKNRAWFAVCVSCVVMLAAGVSRADGLVCSGEDLIGSVRTPGSVLGVELVGDTAYVIDPEFGLYLFDVSNPSSPAEVGHFSDPDLVDDYQSLQAVGDRVYIGVRTRRDGDQVLIFDASVAGQVTLLGAIEGPFASTRFQVVGGFAFCVNGEFFTSFDVSDPASPQVAGEYSGVTLGGEMMIVDGVAYVADLVDGAWGLRIIDVSDPFFSDPFSMQLGAFQTGFRVDVLHADGERMFLSESVGDLRIYDISDPAQIEQIGSYDPLGFVRRVMIDGNEMTLLCSGSGLEIVRIDDPGNPVLVRLSGAVQFANDAVVDGGLMLVASGYGGLRTLRVPADGVPVVGEADLGASPSVTQVDAESGYVYAAFFSQGIKVYDARGAGDPVLAGSYTPNGNAIAAQVDDAILYAGIRAGEEELPGVHVVDVSDPAMPERIGFVRIEDLTDLVVRGGIVYAVSGGTTLHIVDARDPADPVIRSELYLGLSVESMAIGDGMLYANNFVASEGVMVIDVRDLAAPAFISSYNAFEGLYLTGVAVEGETMFVVTSESEDFSANRGTGHPGGLYILDASDPNAIGLVGAYESRVSWAQPVVRGDSVFVGGGLQGLMQFDISDVSAPRFVGAFYAGSGMSNAAIDGGDAYVATSSFTGTLYRVDVSDSCSRCDADLTGDGQLHHFDVGQFVQLYFEENPAVDFNFDGQLNYFDVAVFLASFNSGCP